MFVSFSPSVVLPSLMFRFDSYMVHESQTRIKGHKYSKRIALNDTILVLAGATLYKSVVSIDLSNILIRSKSTLAF